MADKPMNEFNTGSSMDYVYAEDASGNQSKVSKANVADELWGYSRATVSSQDWNTLTTPGLYNVSNATGSNKPQHCLAALLSRRNWTEVLL